MLESKRTYCTLCSLACQFEVVSEEGAPRSLEFVLDDPVTAGGLCAKGNMAFELLRLPGRVEEPLVGERATRWPEALSRLAGEIERLPSGSVGLVLGGDATAEDARIAGAFAEKCLGGAPAGVAFGGNEAEVLAEAGAEPAVPDLDLSKLGEFTVVLAVGDVFALCPVISRKALDARYAGRGHALAYVGPEGGLTSRMASVAALGPERRAALAVLKELTAGRTGGAAALKKAVKLLGDVEPGLAGAAEVARALGGADKVAVLCGSADPVAVRMGRLIGAALGDKAAFAALTESASARDILGAWRPETDVGAMAEDIRRGRVKGLLVLGADLVGAGVLEPEDLKKLSVSAAASAFPSETTAGAGFVLPAALWMEKSGTAGGAERRAAVPPCGAGRSYEWILTGLARELGTEPDGGPAGGVGAAMELEEAIKLAAEADGPAAPWTAREPSDPLLRNAAAGVYVA
jgi:anaerobic selenocysteine-containing dehydrogenase